MKLTHLLMSMFLFSMGAAGQFVRPQAPPANSGPPQPPGSIAGKVTNAVTGQPVKRATVNLGGGSTGYVTVTDDSGNFLFDSIQPGKDYYITADAEGYAGQFDFGPPGMSAITVGPQQEVKDIALHLSPLSVISGKVLDDEGEPLPGAFVQTISYQYQNGVKRLIANNSATTDDRGQYRIFDLQPGRYYLGASVRHGPVGPPPSAHVHSTVPEEGFATAYHPGAGSVTQATSMEVKPGADLNGVDFRLHKVPTFHIRGVMIDGQTRQPVRGNVQVEECENGASMGFAMQSSAAAQPNGSFDARGVIPGSYCLSLRENGQRGVAARQNVNVKNEDVNGVVLAASSGFEVQGSAVIDGTPPANQQRLFVRLEAEDGSSVNQNQSMNADLTFKISDVFPGVYQVYVQVASGQMYVKSLRYGNQEVPSGKIQAVEGSALTITLGTDPGGVSGVVEASAGGSGTQFAVLVAPAGENAARRDLQRVVMNQNGKFQAVGLAPGEYKVFALETRNMNELENTDLRKLLADKAASVTVHAGGQETIQVRAISAEAIAEAKSRLQ
jgi:hypothetical protein